MTLAAAAPAVVAGAGVHDAVSITAGTGAPVLGDLQLRFTRPGNAPPDALVAYLDERRHQWIPVPTERTGNELVAIVGHLTDFAWFDDLRATVGAFFGVRAAAPKCEPARPDWVQGLYTTDGADAQILACVETAGGDVKMKIVNNRAYPVALQLSATPKSSAVDFGWPASVRDVLDRMAAAVVGTGPRHRGQRPQRGRHQARQERARCASPAPSTASPPVSARSGCTCSARTPPSLRMCCAAPPPAGPASTSAVQGALPSLGFDGVGQSGYGRRHGVEGFREFSNPRGVVMRGSGDLTGAFLPPYGPLAQAIVDSVIIQPGPA